ncbi:MAG: hypothetical protein L0Z62_28940 [Gemmataceae bacterium]|nr:hypothetical protein [Gemmataceae bacterium]
MADVDFQGDLLYITYDPKKVTPEEMLETVQKQGFQGQIVPGNPNEPDAPARENRIPR